MLDPTAFDAFAHDYDQDFTHSKLGQLLRPRVWQHLGKHFGVGDKVLELACGTGEDAVWLAKRGVHVTATDGSSEMVRVTREKGENAGISSHLTPTHLTFQQILNNQNETLNAPFDGAFSNFGGINTINDLTGLANRLAQLIRPNGKIILVPMGNICFWEMGWYGIHGQFNLAMRRFRQPATAIIGQKTIPIWYPSVRQLHHAFAPHFNHLYTESLGVWLPPSYLDHFVDRFPRLFTQLNKLEQATARLTRNWGDHFISVLERK